MTIGEGVTVSLAFLAGFLSFISPCCLPLIPAYISYLSGRAVTQNRLELQGAGITGLSSGPRAGAIAVVGTDRLRVMLHAGFFVAGFTLVFVIFGLLTNATLGVLRAGAYDFQTFIGRFGGLLVIFFGLHVMGVTGWALRALSTKVDWEQLGAPGKGIQRGLDAILLALYSDTRRQMNPRSPYGYAGSSMMGVVFAAGWSPCVGPIYGTILTLAATKDSWGQAGVLLLAYSLGLGVPFLLTAAALDQMRGLMKRVQRQARLIELVSGVLLIFMGYLLFTGRLAELAQAGNGFADFSYNLEECVTGVVRGTVPASDFSTCMQLGPNYKYSGTTPAASQPTVTPEPGKSSKVGPGQNEEVGNEVGMIAPDFSTKIVGADRTVTLTSLRGKIVLLNFWATWCGPCRAEMTYFQKLADSTDPKGFTILAVDFNEKPDVIAPFVKDLGLKYDIGLDVSGDINHLYGVNQYPVSFVIGRDGTILTRQIGVFPSQDVLTSAISKWIAAP